MVVYPAIDIKEGKCVRLIQGQLHHETIYGDDPVLMALKWQQAGAQILHIVDLDGAFTGKSKNLDIIKAMVNTLSIPIQLGGGIRNMEDIIVRLEEIGVSRIILGTAALEHAQLVEKAVSRYPGRIIVGIDTWKEKLATHGWVHHHADHSPVSFALKMKSLGVNTIVYTDISKDGTLRGPNVKASKELMENTGLEVIASGGISCLKDIEDLKSAGLQGVIVGKALYSGSISIHNALNV